jgi:ribulose-phosphate 3-epimerase
MIAPSILNADFLHLGRELNMINDSSADWVHLDVMDGVFVPNISFGIPVVEAVARISKKPLDVHLMIVEPERYVTAFRKAGAFLIDVHLEACRQPVATLQQIRDEGCKSGMAIKPDTPVERLFDLLPHLDLALVMSVYPGFGGQTFMEETYTRVERLKKHITDTGANTLIQVDGGVNEQNAGALYRAGADVLVVGSHIFKSHDPLAVIEFLNGKRNQAAKDRS